MVFNQDTYLFLLEFSDNFLDFINCYWINPGERLVEEEELWKHGQRPSDLNTSTLSTRKGKSVAIDNGF